MATRRARICAAVARAIPDRLRSPGRPVDSWLSDGHEQDFALVRRQDIEQGKEP